MHYPYNPADFGLSAEKYSIPSMAAPPFPVPAPGGVFAPQTIPVPPAAQLVPMPPAAQPVPVPPPTVRPQPEPIPQGPLGTGPGIHEKPLVQVVEYTGEAPPIGSSVVPIVTPPPPYFSVPSNPLLPEEYKEILSYENLQYMNGFLRTQIGKECLVSLAIGTGGTIAARLGYLIGVGINYILLQDPCSGEILVCDYYSIRLVQILGKRCPVELLI